VIILEKNVCLIYPPQSELKEPTSYAPLGLLYLASMLEKKNIDVSICNLAGKRDLSIPFADVYGITCTHATELATKKVCHKIRELYPSSRIIVGGPHASVAPHRVYKQLRPDLVVLGEAEERIVDIVSNVWSGFYLCGIVKDLNTLPYPARHLMPKEEFVNLTGVHGSKEPSTTVVSSRGCPYNCSFCCKDHDMFRQFRFRSAENVAGEVKLLRDTYGVRNIRFVDDCFSIDKRRVKRLADKMAELEVTFLCITRADRLDLELVRDLKRGGCIEVDIGVESASPRLLKLMNKNETVDQLRKAIHMIKDNGIDVKVYLMMDYPTETEEDRKMTLDFLRETKPDRFTLSMFRGISGSQCYVDTPDSAYFYPDTNKRYKRYKRQIREAIEGNR